MESLILNILSDPFGVSYENRKTLLQILEDEIGEERCDEIEERIVEISVPTHVVKTSEGALKNVHRRFRLPN